MHFDVKNYQTEAESFPKEKSQKVSNTKAQSEPPVQKMWPFPRRYLCVGYYTSHLSSVERSCFLIKFKEAFLLHFADALQVHGQLRTVIIGKHDHADSCEKINCQLNF